MIGNARKQPDDPSYNMPKSKSIFSQDLAVFLSVSVIANFVAIFLIMLMGLILAVYFLYPPQIMTQGNGVVFYRNTEPYRLRSDTVEAFVRTTLLDIYPYVPDLSNLDVLRYLVVPDLLRKCMAVPEGEKRPLKILEVRRFTDPEKPQFMGIAIKGERSKKFIHTDSGIKQAGDSGPTLIKAYLNQITATLDNPWGLVLVDFEEISDPGQMQSFWDSCTELEGSTDLNGNPILPPKEDYLPKID